MAISARLDGPQGIVLDTEGNIFIADSRNNRLRKVNAESGIIISIVKTAEVDFFLWDLAISGSFLFITYNTDNIVSMIELDKSNDSNW